MRVDGVGGEPAGVETERVVPKVGVPILDEPRAASGEEPADEPFEPQGPEIDLPWIALLHPPVRGADMGVALGWEGPSCSPRATPDSA